MSVSVVRTLGIISTVAAGLALAGCAPAVEDEPTSTPTSSATSAESASPTPTTTQGSPTPTHPGSSAPPTSTKPGAGEEIGISCGQLITAEQMLQFNSNISLIGTFTPTSGSLAAKAADFDGLTCRWQQNSSGTHLDFAVAKLDAATLVSLASDARRSSTAVSEYGDEAYFTRAGNSGTAQIFSGDYWIVAQSPDFFVARDLAPLAEAAIGNLP